ncbi:MAG: hypothetical protein WKF35_11250 [Ferruginibacter sp.]
MAKAESYFYFNPRPKGRGYYKMPPQNIIKGMFSIDPGFSLGI